MGVASAITATNLLTGIIGTAIGGILVKAWQRHHESKDELETWYSDATGIVARVQRVGYRTTEYPPADYTTMREKLDPIADELQAHAASAPSGVPDDHRQQLLRLAAFVTGVIALSERTEDISGLDFLEQVQDHARESVGDDVDMGQVNQLIGDLDTDSIADNLSTDDVEPNAEAIDEFLGQFSDQAVEQQTVQSVDEALEMPLDTLADTINDETVWNELVDDTMRKYARLFLIEIAEDVFESLEDYRNQL